MQFYDYIEVQPPSNYSHLLVRHDINNMEELQYGLEKIIKVYFVHEGDNSHLDNF